MTKYRYNKEIMDQETARYIREHHSHLLSPREREALCYEVFPEEIKAFGKDRWHKIYVEGGFISKDNTLSLFTKNSAAVEYALAERILALYPDRIFVNRCRKCTRQARTPKAKQCRYCGYRWHDLTVATLMFKDISTITGRGPVIVTDFADDGTLQVGQFANLTALGVNKHVLIKGVEFAPIRRNGVAEDLPCLVLPNLSEEDLEWLKKTKPEGRHFEILREGWLF